MSRLSALLATTALVTVTAADPYLALAQVAPGTLPTGGSVAAGGVAIGARQGNTLAITQSTQNAVVNWQGFSIGAQARVDIQQPSGSAALLNRVTGSTPSTIAGQLNANGQVYLVNPNGIAITRSGTVNTGAFVASTLGTTDQQFMAGERSFTGNGASAAVTNAGTITIGRGGYAALIGGKVANSGTITVPMGKVALGSGEQATLDLSGDGFLQVAVPTAAGSKGALVGNSGTISAAGGTVQLSAATARDMARHAINMSGVIEATGVSGTSGNIVLSGGEGGSVQVSGRMDATSTTGSGGAIAVTGRQVALKAATLDASGAAGGGTVQLGGGRQGTGPLPHAQTVKIDARSTIKANATVKGNGGSVVVWSDKATAFAGTIEAKGGPQGGDGGQAEVSSKGTLGYSGTTDLRAPAGRMGTLLLDPENVTISTAADSNQVGFTATGDDSNINNTTLQTALATANVTVSTGSTGNQAGNITVAAPLAWNTGANLTLQAAGNITLDNGIAAAAGGLTLNAGGAITTGSAGTVSVAQFILAAGNWTQNSATLPAFAAGDFQIQGGSFLRATGGTGTTASPYLLTDIYGVQGMGSAALLTSNFQLANNIDATGTAAWNGGAGFAPIAQSGPYFNGSLNGAYNIITNLTLHDVAVSQDVAAGLFGNVGSQGSITNLGLVGVNVSGSTSYLGGLVGRNLGSLAQVYATGTASGSANVGGLVGENDGSITQSYANVAVSGGGNSYSGGLVGYNAGSISQAYSNGAVSASAVFATLGGLVGGNFGAINQVYASGPVSSGFVTSGGLFGQNSGQVTSSYWDFGSTQMTRAAGFGSVQGATGLSSTQARVYYSYPGFDFTNIWYEPGDLRPILRSEAATPVNGVIPVGNLHQLELVGANLSASYQLTASIDASEANQSFNSGSIFSTSGFVPIGFGGPSFNSLFNGAGHIITGLVINRPNNYNVGLFSSVGQGGTVFNVGLVGGSVTGNSNVGDLVGNNYGTVIQTYATGTVTGGYFVGGLVGSNGGLVTQSYTTGSSTGSQLVGGLVGGNFNGVIDRSYASGPVSGNFAGGVAGINSNGVFTSSYWDMQTTGQASAVGTGSGSGAAGMTSLQARTSSSYSGFDFTNVWYQAGDLRPILRSEAAPAVNGVIPVGNLHQLQLMAANPSASYRLTGSIDASETNQTTNTASVFGPGGFVPVGDLNAAFSGSFNGAGYTIAGLTVRTASSNFYGLFGEVGGAGSVSNVGLIGGSVRGGGNVGGLVGFNNGGTISQSFSSVSVTGFNSVGGLVGFNSGSINQAYASGTILGAVGVGGLVGVNTGAISQAYATGSVFGSIGQAGGLVGNNIGTVSTAYAAGPVSSGPVSGAGGIVGLNSGTLTATYWDTQASGQASGVGIGSASGTTGRNTAQMQDLSAFQTNYAGFDFANVWSPPNQVGQNNNSRTAYYPQLYSLSNVVAVTPINTSRVYGASTGPTLLATYNGVRSGDFVTSRGTFSNAATSASNVGTYPDSASGTVVTSTAGRNYRAVYVPTGTVTVTPAPLTIFPFFFPKSYGETVQFYPFDFFSSGLVYGNGDKVNSVSVTSAGAAATASVAGSPYAIIASNAQGSGLGNYAITYIPEPLTVRPVSIFVVANAQSRVYGNANPTLTDFVIDGTLLNGDMLSGSPATTADATSGVGKYLITQGSVTAGSNYNLFFGFSYLTVTARPITLAADAQNQAASTNDPALAFVTSAPAPTAGVPVLLTATTPTASIASMPIATATLLSTATTATPPSTAPTAVTSITPAASMPAPLSPDTPASVSTVIPAKRLDTSKLASSVARGRTALEPLPQDPASGTLDLQAKPSAGVVLLVDPRFAGSAVCLGGGAGCIAGR